MVDEIKLFWLLSFYLGVDWVLYLFEYICHSVFSLSSLVVGVCTKMKRAIQKEFQKSQFNFHHDKPHDFAIYAVSTPLLLQQWPSVKHFFCYTFLLIAPLQIRKTKSGKLIVRKFQAFSSSTDSWRQRSFFLFWSLTDPLAKPQLTFLFT